MTDNPWQMEPIFHEGKGRANLRDVISLDSGYRDLDKLYSVPFKIDAEKDFPLMYKVAHKIHQDRYRISKGLNLSEKEREVVNYALGYDYKPEEKIISSYVYHQLRDDGFSEEFLDDFKTLSKRYYYLLPMGVRETSEDFPRDAMSEIWQEYGNLEKLDRVASLSSERMENSGELEGACAISKKARNQIIKIEKFSSNNGYTPSPCPENWKKRIEPSELHNFKCALRGEL